MSRGGELVPLEWREAPFPALYAEQLGREAGAVGMPRCRRPAAEVPVVLAESGAARADAVGGAGTPSCGRTGGWSAPAGAVSSCRRWEGGQSNSWGGVEEKEGLFTQGRGGGVVQLECEMIVVGWTGGWTRGGPGSSGVHQGVWVLGVRVESQDTLPTAGNAMGLYRDLAQVVWEHGC